MRYNKIFTQDFVNGTGICVSLFVQGCNRAWCGNPCEGCFNKSTWNPNEGKPFTPDVEKKIIELLAPDYINHFSILGGEPLDPANISTLMNLCNHIKQTYPEKQIWLWTGFTFEDIWHRYNMNGKDTMIDYLLSRVDVLVDGPFILSQKSLASKWAGSGNQRVLDCRASLLAHKPVLLEQ